MSVKYGCGPCDIELTFPERAKDVSCPSCQRIMFLSPIEADQQKPIDHKSADIKFQYLAELRQVNCKTTDEQAALMQRIDRLCDSIEGDIGIVGAKSQ